MPSKPSTDQEPTTARTPSADEIKAEAQRLGFCRCGIADAAAVDDPSAQRFLEWIADGRHATMDYMARHADLRLDVRRLVPGARSVVAVAMSYAPAASLPPEGYDIAAYALGRDYHDLMRERLRQLADFIGGGRVCCDTAPVLERYWAQRAGIGFIGRNHQLIVPGVGSMVFLGEVIVEHELPADSPMERSCLQCGACIDACPTGALMADGGFDAARCLSYLTIEHRGPLPQQYASALDNTIYGCDRCQAACPHNRHIEPTTEPSLQPSERLLAMTKADWHRLDVETYRQIFKGSAVKRTKYDGLMRNIMAAKASSDNRK